MLRQSPFIRRGPFGVQAPPGTPLGDQVRAAFLAQLKTALGASVDIWLPKTSDTTTTTDESPNAGTWTYSESLASFDTALSVLGSGVVATFNGTDEEADTPDAARWSFGEAGYDLPFSIVVLVKPDTVDAVRTIIAKWDETTATPLREWWAYMDANGYPSLELLDESSDGIIGREDQTALTAATWVLLEFCYDGSGTAGGVVIRKNSARVDDANLDSGTYTAMENLATKPTLGFHIGASATEEFWDGGIALVAVTAKCLSDHDSHVIRSLCNSFFGLSL